MILHGAMNSTCLKRLKDLKKGEFFKWVSLASDSEYPIGNKNIFTKGSYDRSLKKYECRVYVWKSGDKPTMYNTIPVDDNEWLGMRQQKRIYLEGSTLVNANPNNR